MEVHFAAVDWGTSSFRIWLVDGNGAALAERRSDEGMVHAAETGFERVLETHLAALAAPPALPVVICGMAGSRQGWQEARYLTVPAALSEIVDRAVIVRDARRDIRILPGLAQRDPANPDVMRGEETQLLGGLIDRSPAGLACLPGTHSKWVRLSGGGVTDFSSHMTGELFALLAGTSILRHAVSGAAACDPASAGFVGAVGEGYREPARLSRMLFSLRAAQLLFDAPPTRLYERLSGLLIGGEIAAAASDYGRLDGTRLIASGRLGDLYASAFAALDIAVDVIDADRAVLAGLVIAAGQFWPLPDRRPHFGTMKA